MPGKPTDEVLTQRINALEKELDRYKRADNLLKKERQRFRAQYMGIPVPTYTWQQQGNDFILISCNAAAEKITKGRLKKRMGEKLSHFYQDAPEIIADVRKCYQKKQIIQKEMQYQLRSTKEWKYLDVSYVYIPPDLVMVHTKDITDRKTAEERLELYKAIVEASQEAIAIGDMSGHLLYVNNAHEKLFKRKLDQAGKVNYREYYPPESVEILNRRVSPALERGEGWEGILDVFDADGRCFPLWERADTCYDAEGIPRYTFGIMHDVTEQKAREDALCRIQAAVENACDGITITDADGEIVCYNQGMFRLTGYTLESLLQIGGLKDLFADSGFRNEFVEKMAKQVPWRCEADIRTSEQKLVPILYRADPIFDNLQNFIGIVGIWTDITIHKEVERILLRLNTLLEKEIQEKAHELRESEKRYNELFEQASDAIVLSDSETDAITNFNDKACASLGYTREAFQKLRLTDIFADIDEDQVQQHKEKILKNRGDVFETRYKTKQGEIRDVQVNASLISVSGELLIQTIWHDITERKKAEKQLEHHKQQLIQADKMIALGTLVAGVAHEINNPNNFIAVNTPLLHRAWQSVLEVLNHHYQEKGDFDVGGLPYTLMRERIPMLLSGISEGSERIRNIVKELKDFARHDAFCFTESVDINAAVKTAAILVHNMIKKATNRFHISYGNDIPVIQGNRQRLEQVLINLIQNACQSISHNTAGIFVKTRYLPQCNRIRVTVEDEGCGILPEHLNQITDPFFTTRRDKGGTGLGLSVSATIVHEHSGMLRFHSEYGKGTIVILELPLAESD